MQLFKTLVEPDAPDADRRLDPPDFYAATASRSTVSTSSGNSIGSATGIRFQLWWLYVPHGIF